MDRLAAMRSFATIVDAGSMSAAARQLGLPLTTMSRQLAGLEEQLGVRLLNRTTRRLALTELGRLYLQSCRTVLAELEAADLRLAGQQETPQGELAVTAPVVFGRLHVLPVVTDFLRAHTLVTARMLLVDRVVDLLEEGLDIGIRIGELPDSSLRATRLGGIRYVTCASPAYLAERGTPASPRDLASHDCISFNTLSQTDRWSFGAKQQRVSVKPRLIVNTAEAAIDAAKAGLGIARLLSYQIGASLADGTLRLILVPFEAGPIPVNLVHREDRLPQAKVQSFVTFAVPRLRALFKR